VHDEGQALHLSKHLYMLECGRLKVYLGETEDVINEKEHILPFSIWEMLSATVKPVSPTRARAPGGSFICPYTKAHLLSLCKRWILKCHNLRTFSDTRVLRQKGKEISIIN
jgi:hypothetical protein